MTTFTRFGSAVRTPKGKGGGVGSLRTSVGAFVAAGANPDTGTITDPSVYQRAIQMLSGDNTPAGLKDKANYQNEIDKLKAKLNNAYATKGLLDYSFKNAQYNVGKQYALDPEGLIQHMYSLYDFHATQIENHVKKLQNDGVNASSLQIYGSGIADEAAQYEKLLEAMQNGGLKNDKAKTEAQRFGVAVGTDSDGKITSFALHVIPSGTNDARMTLKGANDAAGTTYVRTNATYGGIPLYLIPQSDPADTSGQGYVAKIGNLEFNGQKSTTGGQNVLELTDKRSFIGRTADMLPDLAERVFGKRPLTPGAGGSFHGFASTVAGGVPTTGNREIALSQGAKVTSNYGVDLFGHITPEDFSNMDNLPAGSLARDATGNFYYVNEDGTLFAAPNADVLSQHINVPAKQIQSSAQPLTSKDLERLQNSQSPDSRANMWLQDPTENSPLNQAGGASSMLQNTHQSNLSMAKPAATPGALPPQPPIGPPMPQTKGQQKVVQAPTGKENQANTTREIAGGKFGPTFNNPQAA